MKYLLFWIITIIFPISIVIAEVTEYISEITFTGNSFFPESKLRSIIKLQSPELFARSEFTSKKLNRDKISLETYYKSKGFLEAEINEEDDAYDEANPPEKDGLAEEDDAYDEPASKEDKNDGVSSSTLAEQEDEEDEESYEVDESLFEQDEDEDEEEAVEEQSNSSEIGKADNKVDVADGSDEEDPGEGELHEIRSELKEYKTAVRFLKDKLHEVNILNAKLLFTNKLFKEFALDNNQKLKVVETFDRTQSTREIKLVYSTLAEQFSDNGSINKRNPIKESASAKSGSTKPSKGSKKVITEEAQVANRFKKLAGII